jgi:hypothetical protein
MLRWNESASASFGMAQTTVDDADMGLETKAIVVKPSKLFSRVSVEEQEIQTWDKTKGRIGCSSGVGSACQLDRGSVNEA